MIILHPNHRPRLDVRQNDFRELEVSFPVSPPVLFVKVHLARVVMEQGPKNRVGETVVVAIRDVVVEVDGLAGVLLHEPLVDVSSVLGIDVETRPSDPSEGHGLFATREGGYETTRGHLEVVLAFGILGDGNWEAVRDHDEVLRVGDVWDLGEARVGGGRWNGHNETILGEIGEAFGYWRDFQRRLVFYLGLFSSGADHNCGDNPDISPFPYPIFHSAIPTDSNKSRFLSLCYLSVRVIFFVHKRTFDPTVQNIFRKFPASETRPTAGEKKETS